jgi:hypothetical protein
MLEWITDVCWLLKLQFCSLFYFISVSFQSVIYLNDFDISSGREETEETNDRLDFKFADIFIRQIGPDRGYSFELNLTSLKVTKN